MTLSQHVERVIRALSRLHFDTSPDAWRQYDDASEALTAARDAAREAHRPVAERAAGRAGR